MESMRQASSNSTGAPRKKQRFKTCYVPQCKSTTIKTPDKLFFWIPKDMPMRQKWFSVARRADSPTLSEYYCCEDHFDLESDVENFSQYKMIKANARLRPCILPHKFECQPDRLSQSFSLSRGAFRKINQKRSIEEVKSEYDEQNCIAKENDSPTKLSPNKRIRRLSLDDGSVLEEMRIDLNQEISQEPMELSDQTNEIDNSRPRAFGEGSIIMDQIQKKCFKRMVSIETQVNMRRLAHYRSKGVSCVPQIADSEVQATVETADEACDPRSSSESSSINTFSTVSTPCKSKSSGESYVPSSSASSSDRSEKSEDRCDKDMKLLALKVMNYYISQNPKMYLGISKECSTWLLQLISKHGLCSETDVKLTLVKLKMNSTYELLGNQFEISASQASRIFHKTVPVLADLLGSLIHHPSRSEAQKNLSIPFRAYYSDVYAIIDALEIEMQKPSDPVQQSLSWSEYKKCNTVKYEILTTGDGTILHVSKGYGGRISDIALFEEDGIIDLIPEGSALMADRGFKHIEEILRRKGYKLIRPPSVSQSTKPTKAEVLETKRIAALRIHVERVIGRVREYRMLDIHSRLDLNMMPLIDDAMRIVCGLINLQSPIIRTQIICTAVIYKHGKARLILLIKNLLFA